MRRARLTFQGAYHHVMNRGINGEKIFEKGKWKDNFLKIIQNKSRKLGIKVLAYCIMDNHYHIVLQNSSGRLSQFMKDLNGQYGLIYRKIVGGKGYVFQSRYKSTLIQEGEYLIMATLYVLLNPVRAKITNNPYNYMWSSIHEYFNDTNSDIVDNEFIESLFDTKTNFLNLLNEWSFKEGLPMTRTREGYILGNDEFKNKSLEKSDRRKKGEVSPNRRLEDVRKDIKDIIKEFENDKGIKIDDIDSKTKMGRELRNELIVKLRDEGVVRYTEINLLPPFKDLKYSYLGRLYEIAKEEMQKCKHRPQWGEEEG